MYWNLPWLVSHQPHKLEKGLEALLHPELLPELVAVTLCGSGVPFQCHIQAGALVQCCSMAVAGESQHSHGAALWADTWARRGIDAMHSFQKTHFISPNQEMLAGLMEVQTVSDMTAFQN